MSGRSRTEGAGLGQEWEELEGAGAGLDEWEELEGRSRAEGAGQGLEWEELEGLEEHRRGWGVGGAGR